ncbi:ABC transporter permease [Actinotalea sp.]|uniref:ABC transporter permease n=1 Tax=Actinotalea sp. TaxID=1872145 RepID=UPI003564A649
MSFVVLAIQYILDPAHWAATATSPLPLGDRLGEHLRYTAITVPIAALIALPLGFFIGHTGRGRQFVIGFTGAMRALPALGVLFFITMVAGYRLSFLTAATVGSLIALTLLAIPSILAGAYAGLESVDRQTIDAARANGMTELQILRQVEIPLALPLIIGGIRSATLQVIATATIASYVGLGGLGRVITSGIGLNDFTVILAGAFLVTALALAVDGVFAVVQKLTSTTLTTGRRENRRIRRDQPSGQVTPVLSATNHKG